MKVYAVQFCDCIYESGFSTMSLHRTIKGAAKVMNELKSADHKEFEKRIVWDSTHSHEAISPRRMRRFQESGMEAYCYEIMEVGE